MYLYNLTLQKATGITHSIHGNFSGSRHQEIILAKGKIIELVRPDPNTGKVHSLLTLEIFGLIRSLMSFRLTGGTKDYAVVGSDSGRIVILEYIPAKNTFTRVHMETFGKSGCRRIVPGQYLAIDPKGRAIMIGAVEKQKLVYIMNRDAQARLTISSPLEAHKSNTLVYSMVGVDVGFENPMFACIEMDYEEADQDATGQAVQRARQLLTYYELDLGLNHVVRKFAEPLVESANALIAVPGGQDGPSGVLVCSENYITYKNLDDQPDIRCPIPRRRNDLDDPERGMILVCHTAHKTRTMFFFFVQTEQGDIFKITLDVDEDMVTAIRMKYFDTVPVASSMCVLKTGFLFIASEFGNHYLYQIAHLGDDDDEPEFSSAMPLEEGDTFYFAPRPLRNLIEVDELESLSPIICSKVADLANDDTPQIYTLCGRGPRSSLRSLRHGLEVLEMAKSDLPGNPNAVWTVKKRYDDEFDAYIIVSFVNATLVLSIGETVEEVTDSGFLGTTPTLNCARLGEDALVQVYPEGIRHIRADKRVNVWRTPGKRNILKCALNQSQVVICLSGQELVYFEMDASGQLNEFTERHEMPAEVVCLALGRVPSGEQRCRFLAVGLGDRTVRIMSLEPTNCLCLLTTQALPSLPESLCLAEMGGQSPEELALSADEEVLRTNQPTTFFLNTGLQNGVLLRAVLDTVTGELSDTRTRYLGSRPVKLFSLRMQGSEAVLALSSRTWLCYTYQSRCHLTPLSYEQLEHASGFSSEQCPEGVVALCNNSLRIVAVEKLGTVFNQVTYPLEYTPRKFVIHPESNNFIVIETDHNAYTQDTKIQRKREMAEKMLETPEASGEAMEFVQMMAAAFLAEDLSERTFGAPKAGPRMWASVIRVINPTTGETVQRIALPQNEAAHSIALCKFHNRGNNNQFVVVGTVRGMLLNPRSHEGGCIHTFQVVRPSTGELALVHETAVDDIPAALCAFHGRLLAGIGRRLRLYEMGKKKLLKKCENKHIPNLIVRIETHGRRIIVADVQESLFWLRYHQRAGATGENQMIIFADDSMPRWVTTFTMLDACSVALGDKFGNVSVLRLPPDCSDDVEDDPSGNRALWDRGVLGGSSQKTELLCQFYVGETVTSMERCVLIPGGSECILYTTLSGALALLMPFTSKENYELMQHLEMHMRSENISLVGRDHLHFRSTYFPCRNVVDGDVCEAFNNLETAKQKSIAEEIDKQPTEIAKRLEDLRTRYAF